MRCRTAADRRPYVRLTVRDTGVGMDQATRARLFEPFFTTKPAGKGTGLGLATVFGIVSMNHGFIEVESELGRGSTFHVFLPLAPGEPEPLESARSQSARGGRETLLLVEDEPGVRLAVATVLREAGYDVVEASRPSEAFARWQTHAARIALVVTDVVMPEMSGRQLVTELRKEKPGLPALFMTGYDPQAEQGTAGSPCISKPFSPDRLLEALRVVLERPNGGTREATDGAS
jgi:two-component system, cell cycle sensor histidine kinase and response regulator CckA